MKIPMAKFLSVLAILGIFGVIAGITAVTAQEDTDSAPTDVPTNVPVPDPTPEYTTQESLDMAMAARSAARTQALVIQGTPLDMPSDAINAGRIVQTDFLVEVPAGVTIEPLELPFYIIHRNGEAAAVSETTGDFQVGENHEATFQFLVDQLGRDKMHLVDNDFYEQRWSPFRADALAEGAKLR